MRGKYLFVIGERLIKNNREAREGDYKKLLNCSIEYGQNATKKPDDISLHVNPVLTPLKNDFRGSFSPPLSDSSRIILRCHLHTLCRQDEENPARSRLICNNCIY
jgi:hypothetical protein